jgi:xanthine dehydrogenase accessory factor
MNAMTITRSKPHDLLDEMKALRESGEAFAIATVVRTVSLTAAKAGAKALIRSDGSMQAGWIGGGCARAAVLKAARAALEDGRPRLISVQPGDALQEHGVKAGQNKDGVEFAKNMCPSQGTMDVFVEPVLQKPDLLVCGATPVALALVDLGRRLGFRTIVAAPAEEQHKVAETDIVIHGYDLSHVAEGERYIVIATQGKGDEAALTAALAASARYVAFVGSHKKAAALRVALGAKGVDPARLSAFQCPAGLDIAAVTPEEIALSILAEIIAVRRRGQRGRPPIPAS